MKKYLGVALILWSTILFAPAVSLAEPNTTHLRVEHHWRRWHSLPRGEAVPAAPELDPRGASQTLALVLGSLLLVRSRRRVASA